MLAQPLAGATVAEQEQGTVGERIYLIREALGTRRDPMPLDKFAELIERATGAVYDKSILSRMETGERKVSLDEVAILASVDPLKRGRGWLAWGEDSAGGASPTHDGPAPEVRQVRTRPEQEISHLGTPKKGHRRRSNGNAG
jgi:hypothetical protein